MGVRGSGGLPSRAVAVEDEEDVAPRAPEVKAAAAAAEGERRGGGPAGSAVEPLELGELSWEDVWGFGGRSGEG